MDAYSFERLPLIAIQLACVVVSVVIHEVAHGFAAYRLGDTTAKRAGRLTLNPIKHLDPFGSVVLPLLMSLTGGAVFAYAKPVPYNPDRLSNRRWGELIVAFAGPFSNLVQAFVGAGICLSTRDFLVPVLELPYDLAYWVYLLGGYYCLVNLVLMFFNIIPLPPLDGASIVAAFLDRRGMEVFYRIKQYSMFILLSLLFLVPQITPWDPLGWYLSNTAYTVFHILIP